MPRMPLIVRSPYSGQPVKVRDQDLGRAIRDEQGRIFYVVPRSEGQGYYAAPTRKGSEKDEQRYLDLERKVAEQGEVARAVQQQALHDATGPGRPVSPIRLIVLVLILLAVIAAAVLFLLPPELSPFTPVPPTPTPEQPEEPQTRTDSHGSVFSPAAHAEGWPPVTHGFHPAAALRG
ncbi:MAG: hypothetical protein WD534_18930 [Phycisphaeraceae bacterium]